MTWMGWDNYDPPGELLNASIYPAWVSENELVVFLIGYTVDDATYKLYSQRCAVNSAGQLTPESGYHEIRTLDSRLNWSVRDVQVNADGHLLVYCFHGDVSSG